MVLELLPEESRKNITTALKEMQLYFLLDF